MVAQIAPHFNANDIPEYGKTNLWFLWNKMNYYTSKTWFVPAA
jgi:hypothetical protein